jgi:hypothetical protein
MRYLLHGLRIASFHGLPQVRQPGRHVAQKQLYKLGKEVWFAGSLQITQALYDRVV